MVEGARLESGYTLIAYRGFESLLFRQTIKTSVFAGVFLLPLISQIYRKYELFARLPSFLCLLRSLLGLFTLPIFVGKFVGKEKKQQKFTNSKEGKADGAYLYANQKH